MCEKDLLKYVSDVMVVSVFQIIFKGVKCKITNLPLCIKKLKNEMSYFFTF